MRFVVRPLLVLSCLICLSADTPTGLSNRQKTARDLAWQVLKGDYDAAATFLDGPDDRQKFARAMQQVLELVGRPIEITGAIESEQRELMVTVDVRCQRASLKVGVTFDDDDDVDNLNVNFAFDPGRPITGRAVPELSAFDGLVLELMQRWDLVGAQLAVVKDGRLVLSRGYGFADLENQEPVQPDSLFRIASLSKSLTAAAILRLVERGRLDLDARAFDLIDPLEPPDGATVDPRIDEITVRQLLWHAGGWDRNKTHDPMFRSRRAAESVGVDPPAGCETVIRYMLGRTLDFDPGSDHNYSNFGYCVLGRIVEKLGGESYEKFVRSQLLEPAGIERMQIGATLPADRPADEVRYYDWPGAEWAPSVFAPHEKVPFPDGGFHLEAMDSHGGWIASAQEMLKFVTRVDGWEEPADFLTPASIETMIARPDLAHWKESSFWAGMGWFVRPQGTGANWWHGGSLRGSTSLMVRANHGVTWAILINTRPHQDRWGEFDGELDRALWNAHNNVREWPEHDLFE